MMTPEEGYKIAEKRIEEALRTGAEKLNLRLLSLTRIPKKISQLKKLIHLYLGVNQLATIPTEITQLTNLEYLDLDSNQLTEIPVEIGRLTNLQSLYLSDNKVTEIPAEIAQLTNLQSLHLSDNKVTEIPVEIGKLTKLQSLNLSDNKVTEIPTEIAQVTNLDYLQLAYNQLTEIPVEIAKLTNLESLDLDSNQLTEIPTEIAKLTNLRKLYLDGNQLSPELQAAYDEGLDSLFEYLHKQSKDQITLNEAKLILIGEGAVGKSCLLDALRDEPFQEYESTHGIQIQPVVLTDVESGTEITLNGWDFGGQRVYRPTHQLFFSSPAVYLVVWKPREGPNQGFVEDWIRLVLHREPEAKILIVATHRAKLQRQPDLNLHTLQKKYGANTIIGFHHVNSKDCDGEERVGIDELKKVIAEVAVSIPGTRRTVNQKWQEVRETLKKSESPYMDLKGLLMLCENHSMNEDEARLFLSLSHRMGHLIHYKNDPLLNDLVILKPDWLATAISFVLDDEETRSNSGLVPFSRLSYLWNNPKREDDQRYPVELHKVFVRLMERFDLSYRVADPAKNATEEASLIAQLVPESPDSDYLVKTWPDNSPLTESQQLQICQIVDEKGNSAKAEGLFYQLIVRLHKYSLGREDFSRSIHWQNGLILDGDYNGLALLEQIDNDVKITVRAAYPGRFLTMLTEEVKYLIDSFWEGLRCDIMVPCIEPCGNKTPGSGLYPVDKLIDSKNKDRDEYPCPVCDEWQDIDSLLLNAPMIRPTTPEEFVVLLKEIKKLRKLNILQHDELKGRFDKLDSDHKAILSKVELAYQGLLSAYTDEAKDGPRLFSFEPVDRSSFNPKNWVQEKFKLTLWCEHSKLPLPYIGKFDPKRGVIEIEITRKWMQKAGPYLKLLAGTLSLVLPVASSAVKVAMDEAGYKAFEDQLKLGSDIVKSSLGATDKIVKATEEDVHLRDEGKGIRAEGAALRELHALLKEKDPGFGGLVRVMNKRQEFLWVHEKYKGEY